MGMTAVLPLLRLPPPASFLQSSFRLGPPESRVWDKDFDAASCLGDDLRKLGWGQRGWYRREWESMKSTDWDTEVAAALDNWGLTSLGARAETVPHAPRISPRRGLQAAHRLPVPPAPTFPLASPPHSLLHAGLPECLLQLWRKFWGRGVEKP